MAPRGPDADLSRCKSAPSGLQHEQPSEGGEWQSLVRKAVVLTTPRRRTPGGAQPQGNPRRRARVLDPGTGLLEPVGEPAACQRTSTGTTASGASDPSASSRERACSAPSRNSISEPLPPPPSPPAPSPPGPPRRSPQRSVGSVGVQGQTRGPRSKATPEPLFVDVPVEERPRTTDGALSLWRKGKLRSGSRSESEESDDENTAKAEIERLRRRLHLQATELQETCSQLDQTQTSLQNVQAAHEELEMKHGTLERLERTTNSDLLEERRKYEELSKQVQAMRQNLASITGSVDGSDAQQATALQRRCFKLMQQNTVLKVNSRLLRRQKGWAEAKARVLQSEVSSVYLGTHDRVKDTCEIETATEREFAAGRSQGDEAQMYKLTVMSNYRHEEAVCDFLTHITHTHGKDAQGFLQGSRVFSEEIRSEILTGLGREFHALWRASRQLPQTIRAVDRIVHLKDYLAVFEGFSSEMASMVGCMRVRLWMVDHYRQLLWTCVQDAEGKSRTLTLMMPKSKVSSDLAGQGFPIAAYMLQKVLSVVTQAHQDPRYHEVADSMQDVMTRTALCVPIREREGSQIRVVVQALNKTQDAFFNSDTDAQVMRLLGRVALEVIHVSEASAAKAANSKRKDTLLKLFTEFLPIDGPVSLLQFHENALKRLFNSCTTALFLIHGRDLPFEDHGITQLRIEQDSPTGALILDRVQQKGFRGLVGHVARKLNQVSFSYSQLGDSQYCAEVDVVVPGGNVVHTVPICEGVGCVAVCQFVCYERDRSTIQDDGSYHQDNHLHFRLLQNMLNLVRKHLSVFEGPAESRRQSVALQF